MIKTNEQAVKEILEDDYCMETDEVDAMLCLLSSDLDRLTKQELKKVVDIAISWGNHKVMSCVRHACDQEVGFSNREKERARCNDD